MTPKFLCCALATASFCLARAQDCEGLANLKLPQTKVTLAQMTPSGTFTPPWGKPIAGVPRFCRVAGVSRPSADSEIAFEVWMPSEKWNGKFHAVGNGGFAGLIEYQQMANAISHGYATASTNTGHKAERIDMVDASWALGHPEKIIDFGYRAIHLTATNAKAVIAAFYGSGPKHSYFSSCSNGGRQALMETQRYPDDYDGIIAGAPANYWTHLLANAAWDLETLQNASYIPPAKLPAIEAAALAACDAQDGVKDGVIEDPPRCRFDTSVLLCKGAENDSCLTAPQLEALNKLYTGAHTSNGKPVFAGYSPGGEAEPGGWEPWITGNGKQKSLLYMFSTEFFKNMVFSDPRWDFRTLDIDRDTKIDDEKLAQLLNANDPDLSRFEKRGGKLILYHGWSDAAIAAGATVDYYNRVAAKMGAARTHDFVRLFMVPGMQHCGGGAGPNEFGQSGPGTGDAQYSIDAALERWVEAGTPPDVVIAEKRDKQGQVVRTRPLCAYPAVAHYKGSGSTDEAENFACGTAGHL